MTVKGASACPKTRHKTVAQLVQDILHRSFALDPPGLESRRPRCI